MKTAKEKPFKCPKCGHGSGDSWDQCERRCPMPGSPHYVPDCVDPDDQAAVAAFAQRGKEP